MKNEFKAAIFAISLLSNAAFANSIEGAYVCQGCAMGLKLEAGKYYMVKPDGKYLTNVDLGDKRGGPVWAVGLPYRVNGNKVVLEKVHGADELKILPNGELEANSPDGSKTIYRRK